MRRSKPSIRDVGRAILKPIGLLPAAQYVTAAFGASPAYRDHERRYRQLKRQHGDVLGARLNNANNEQRVALIWGPSFPEVQIELGLIKGLQLANFVPVVIIMARGREGRLLAKHYELAGVKEVIQLEFDRESNRAAAEDIVNRCTSPWDLLELERGGVRVGRFAVSTALRGTLS